MLGRILELMFGMYNTITPKYASLIIMNIILLCDHVGFVRDRNQHCSNQSCNQISKLELSIITASIRT